MTNLESEVATLKEEIILLKRKNFKLGLSKLIKYLYLCMFFVLFNYINFI